MVDVRCGPVERCNTFRFDGDYIGNDHQQQPSQQRHIHLQSGDLENLNDAYAGSCRTKSGLKNSHEPFSFTSLTQSMDGDPPRSNHRHHHHHLDSSQLHLLAHHQQQQQPANHRQRLSPSSKQRYRHRHAAAAAASRTSLLHPSRFGREYLASSDEELSRSAAAAEALMLWQRR